MINYWLSLAEPGIVESWTDSLNQKQVPICCWGIKKYKNYTGTISKEYANKEKHEFTGNNNGFDR